MVSVVIDRELYWAYRKVGPKTRDFWWNPRPETRDPSHRWDPEPETRDPKSGTRDLRTGTELKDRTRDRRRRTLKVGPKTRDSGS